MIEDLQNRSNQSCLPAHEEVEPIGRLEMHCRLTTRDEEKPEGCSRRSPPPPAPAVASNENSYSGGIVPEDQVAVGKASNLARGRQQINSTLRQRV